MWVEWPLLSLGLDSGSYSCLIVPGAASRKKGEQQIVKLWGWLLRLDPTNITLKFGLSCKPSLAANPDVETKYKLGPQCKWLCAITEAARSDWSKLMRL